MASICLDGNDDDDEDDDDDVLSLRTIMKDTTYIKTRRMEFNLLFFFA